MGTSSTLHATRHAITWAETTQKMHRILTGECDLDVMHALSPLIGPDTDIETVSIEERQEFELRARFKKWGLENLYTMRKDRFPPLEIWKKSQP